MYEVMIPAGLISLLILIAVHLFANRMKVLGWLWHGRFLYLASGISFAYVFVDLLPALEKGESVLKRTFDPLIPYLDKHVYLVALLGVLFYYGVQTRRSLACDRWLPASGYLLFNFFIGASLSDSSNPEIQPLALFTIAIGMHYFVRDHLVKISSNKPILWALCSALLAGYLVGTLTKIPDAVTAIGIAFVSGGMILNVLHYELPKPEKGGFPWFVLGALGYSVLLLGLGDLR